MRMEMVFPILRKPAVLSGPAGEAHFPFRGLPNGAIIAAHSFVAFSRKTPCL
jgi:hypothetical protein